MNVTGTEQLSTIRAPRIRVLIVDDEPAVARVIAHWLEGAGLLSDIALTAGAAMAAADGKDYALILADLHMPGTSGLDLARRFKASNPERQVIIMTGDHAVEMAVEALRVGADDYLVKPFEAGVLVHSVRRAVEHRRLLLENLEHRLNLEARVREQSKRLERLFLSSIHSLVTALEAKDPYTRGHSDRVTGFALALHDLVGGCDRESLRLGAQLHDIGKIGVRSPVLLKEEPLTAVELGQLKQHPLIGVRILSPLLDDQEALAIVRHHHERWDGAGYPDGLAGKAIPRAARIVALADAFDAMTTIRPYRAARSGPDALAELEAEAGRQFDPELVAAAGDALLEPASLAS